MDSKTSTPNCTLEVTYQSSPRQEIRITCVQEDAIVRFMANTQNLYVRKVQGARIVFKLSPKSSHNNGFEGIKIWQGRHNKPATSIKNGKAGPLTVSSRDTTQLNLDDDGTVKGAWRYSVGIRLPGGDSFFDDPKIYNNGEPPDPPWHRRALGFVRRFFS